MQNSQISSSRNKVAAFVDYKPAELRIAKQWLIVYYAKNPITKELQRHRLTVPMIASRTERVKQGKKIVLEINKKLETGWNPFYSTAASEEFKTFEFCIDKFIEQTKKEVENGSKRADTLRSYTSFTNMIKKYVAEKKIPMQLILEFNQPFVVNYLDWIYYDRGNSPRTYNNHLLFIGTFVNYCISRGHLKNNFTTAILRKENNAKIRQVLTADVKNKVKELQDNQFNYYVLCMATYFCFIRRTELCKLKVKHINLNKNYITIPAEISKNRKNENVTIPNAYMKILAEHLQDANNNDFWFSDNDFKAGEKQLNPKKISDTWERIRKQKGISAEYQFYSLKDTGITDLLNSGIPALKVRDQARHYDLKITEGYTARNINCDDAVKNSSNDF